VRYKTTACSKQLMTHMTTVWFIMRVFVPVETSGLRHSGNVERLAIDAPAPADRDDQDVPVCRTNTVVASYFKYVKHGRLNRWLRVRPPLVCVGRTEIRSRQTQ